MRLTTRFGKRVRTLREESKLSQEQLGERAALDRTYISGVERGLRNPSLLAIAQIADALELSLSELFRNV
jgi:transcriptional regulator with XRE-family HTH domain